MSFEEPLLNSALSHSQRGAGGPRFESIPKTPPAELQGEIDRAAERVDELHSEGRELHFAYNAGAGRVLIEVRDLDGNVLRVIPPSEALWVIGGRRLD